MGHRSWRTGWACGLALAGLHAAAGAALAGAAADGGTVWLCGLSDDLMRLVCVADTLPAADAALPAPTVQVRGTRFPLDPRGRWTVDLWSPADDPAALQTLARATICYRSPGCEVVLGGRALQAVAQARRR